MASRIRPGIFLPWLVAIIIGFILAPRPMGAVSIGLGSPGYLSTLLLASSGCLGYSLTHYSAGLGPVFYGAGFVDFSTRWKIGFRTSLLHIIIWAGTGLLWWKFLELW